MAGSVVRTFANLSTTADDILEPTEAFTVTLVSTNAQVDPSANSFTLDIVDENSWSLHSYYYLL